MNSDKHRLTAGSFRSFRERFTQQIDAADFGDPPQSEPEDSIRESPARRELLRTGMSDSLRSNSFLRKIYRLVVEHAKLESERTRVSQFAKGLRPHIRENRDAQKRLATTARQLGGDFLSKYGTVLGAELVQAVYSVVEQLENIGHSLRRIERLQVSRIPPAARKESDEPSAWQLLLKEVDYDLPSVSVKAADQWFYERVDVELVTLVRSKRLRRLTELTRMKLISAIWYAAGMGLVEPTTIKEYLRSKKLTVSANLKEK